MSARGNSCGSSDGPCSALARPAGHAHDRHLERHQALLHRLPDRAVAEDQRRLARERVRLGVLHAPLGLAADELGQVAHHRQDHRQYPLGDRDIVHAARVAERHARRHLRQHVVVPGRHGLQHLERRQLGDHIRVAVERLPWRHPEGGLGRALRRLRVGVPHADGHAVRQLAEQIEPVVVGDERSHRSARTTGRSARRPPARRRTGGAGSASARTAPSRGTPRCGPPRAPTPRAGGTRSAARPRARAVRR